jgi:pimeloyl-ACP methyl ester carboxylesterase
MRADGSFRLWYQYFQQQRSLAEAMIPGNEDVWVRHFFGRAGREGRISEAALAEYVRCYAIKDTPATGAFYYRAMREDAKRWDELAGAVFPMPALYIYGNGDVVIIREYLKHIEECFRDVRVVEVEAEHYLHEERPGTVADILNDFLRP